jgi:hypothetical protein
MQRTTARALFVLFLVSVLAPVALAFSTVPLDGSCTGNMQSHACCMRKMRAHPTQQIKFEATSSCHSHCCCVPMAPGQWAEFGSPVQVSAALTTAVLQRKSRPFVAELNVSITHSGRAPPATFLD